MEKVIICKKCEQMFDYEGKLPDQVNEALTNKKCVLLTESCNIYKNWLNNFYKGEVNMEEKIKDILSYFNQLKELENNTVNEIDKEFIKGEISGIRITLHKLGLEVDGIEGY